MSDGPVAETREAGGSWLRLTIDRPPGNILALEVVSGLRAALARIPATGPLKLLTLEGAGADFSFGASIEEHRPGAISRVLPETHNLIRDLLDLPVVTAAIVNGRCLGGGFELAMACDFVFAATHAVFGLPEIALGVFPPAAAALLGARVGAARASAAIITGEQRSAREWHEAGLVSLVAEGESLERAVQDWFAVHLRPRSAEALRHAAKAARLAFRGQIEGALAGAERLYLGDLMASRDAGEGIAAFLEKREPKWTDS